VDSRRRPPPHAGSGVKQALLGTIKRPEGTAPVTYNVIRCTTSPATPTGEDHGQGSKALGAGWYVVNASGSKIDTD